MMQARKRVLTSIGFCGVFFGLSGYGGYYWRQSRLNNQLLTAIQSRQGDHTVQDLIWKGANPTAVGGNEYDTALLSAIQMGQVSTAQVLLANGASVRPVGNALVSPAIALACYRSMNAPNDPILSVADYLALFKDLQHHGESIEERDVLGYTPLMRAVWSGNAEATEALLKLGANSHVVNSYHQTVWDWTEQYPDKKDELRNLLSRYAAQSERTTP